MRRLLVTTTALSVALGSVTPFPLMAQTVAEDGSIIADDGTILCLATDGNECNIADFTGAAADEGGETKEERRARRQAEKEAAAAAEAAAQAEAEAQAAAEQEAAAQAAAEAEAAAQAEAEAQAAAEQEAAAQAAAEAEAAAQAEAEAQAAAEQEAAAQAAAEAEAAAQAEAEAQAAAEQEAAAQAAAEAEAAAQAEAEAQAAAEQEAAEQAAAEAEAAAQAEEPAVTEEAPAEEAQPAEETVTEEPVADEATTTEAPAAEDDLGSAMEKLLEGDEAAADPAATEEPAVDAAATEDAATEDAAVDETTGDETATEDAPADDTATAEPVEPVEPVVNLEPVPEDQVELVAPTEEAVDQLTTLLAQPEASDETAAASGDETAPVLDVAPLAAETLVSAPTDGPVDLADLAPPADVASVTVQEVTEDTQRSSSEEFKTVAKEGDTRTEAQKNRDKNRNNGGKNGGKNNNRDDDDELSDLEKAGLVALGAVAVGMIINAANQDRVVANSGDRVVVQRGNGNYVVYKDDDALLRQPGSTVRTETYRDGSTRTIIQRADGTQIVTIRDATGRVLRRSAFDARGREILLVDDLQPETRVDVSTLPVPRGREISISGSEEDALLRARMAAMDAEELGRSFSLRQIREIPQVRALAATIDVNNITFDSGSAAIKSSEAEELSALGRFITAMIRENPAEMFLIEGHTDAVGSAASNLALSDRRAESVALALTEYFGVPAENMIVQGYGESELRVNTQADERQNRRAAVRVITPLLRTASAN